MNQKRRESISKISNALDDLKCQLETLLEEEQEYYDNMPEGFQNADKGEAAQSAISALEYAVSNLEDTVGNLEEASE
jgi:flagellar biosynthesis chaperone FliJ